MWKNYFKVFFTLIFHVSIFLFYLSQEIFYIYMPDTGLSSGYVYIVKVDMVPAHKELIVSGKDRE